MVLPARRRLSTGLVVAAGVLALGLGGAPSASAAPGGSPAPTPPTTAPAAVPGRYIVTLTQQPVASYRGGVAGYPSTRPAQGRRVEVGSGAAQRYRAYVARTQDGVAAGVGARVEQRYSVSLNAFVADLTPQQVERLRSTRGVLGVSKDVLRKPLDDTRSVDFLHLSGKKGVWRSLGGTGRAGRGVVVGVVDTGVWPESASFRGPALGSAGPTSKDPYRPYRVGDQVRMVKSDGSVFVGTCQTGAGFDASDCNTKLISARYFGKTWLAGNTPGADEYVSPRDGDEHGTHTASTAAGDADVEAVVGGRSYGTVSGVAPAAKVAVYKALWTAAPGKGDDGGTTSDILAAIDQAVADGVDVLNYSVGGTTESDLVDPVQVAFLQAASAGVFVAVSAGNDGPGASTLENTAPWVTTVAATSVKRYYGTVELGNGARHLGVTTTVAGKLGPVPLVAGADAAVAGARPDDAALCSGGTLDPAKVAGAVVTCDRGGSTRVEKSAEVARAGGVGMVLLNLTADSQDGDLHAVPTIVLDPPASAAVKAYAATPGARVTLRQGNTSGSVIPYPQVAGFSSRGPSLANGGDLLKPDLAAPGVDVLAAAAPNTANHQVPFTFLSGTSMASPQVAGLAAVYLGKHPRYSPMAVKSALMTTAADTVDAKNHRVHDAYAQGAGIVSPKRMFDPGVVLESSEADWQSYLEGQGVATESGARPVDPSDYNAPSIAVGSLVGTQTVVRRITGLRTGTYRVRTTVPGFSVRSSASKLRFAKKGQTKTLRLTFTRRSAALGAAAFGAVSITSSKASARLPVALTPVAVSAPAEIRGTGTSGSTAFTATAGESGSFPVRASGLVLPESDRGAVSSGGQSERFFSTVGPGVPLARFAVDSDSDAADVDLTVYRQANGTLVPVGSSGTTSGDEQVTLDHPQAGVYVTEVRPFSDPPGVGSTSFTANRWVVAAGSSGFAVSPAAPVVRNARTFTLTPSWQGLQPGSSYLGWVEYPDGTGTVVSVAS